MKKSSNRILRPVLGVLAVLAVLSSCGAVLHPESGNSALIIRFQDSLGRTIAPELSMDAELVTVTVTAPNGSGTDYDVAPDGTLELEDLVFGTYGLSAAAYNADGNLIGSASATVELDAGEIATVVLDLRPLEGQGTLSLEVFWNESNIQTPIVEASLLAADGTETVLDMIVDGGTASCETSLDAGYYSLSVSLYDDDFLSFGWMEIVRIIADETSEGSLDFTNANINGGSIEVVIDVNLENPLHPIIEGASDIVAVSEPMVLSASVEEELSGVSFLWYVMGIPAAQGDEFVFSSDEQGTYRIDLAAFSVDGSRAGSTGFSTYVSEDVQPNYTRISEVQGASHTSPMAGDAVEDVLGVVTAVEENGFWMQSPAGDGDPATSEGLYVYTYSTHSFEVGDLVLVDGTVQEYGYSDQLKLTELSYVTVEVISSGYPLPDPVVIGTDGVLPPSEVICNDANETVYDSLFDPEEDAIDFYESLESMLVEIEDPVTVGGTKYGEIPVIPEGTSYASETPRGGLLLTEDNANPQLLLISTIASILGLDTIQSNLGDTFTEPVTGIVGYDYGKFIILPTEEPSLAASPVARETSGLTTEEDDLTVATFNIENFPRDDEYMTSSEIQDKIEEIANTIASALDAPDIVALQEMTDDSYSDDDGTVSAAGNAADLIAAVTALGGPAYEYLEVEPEDNAEGGWPGANIRVGILYNPARVDFTPVGTPASTAETSVIADGENAALTLNPGRFSIDSFAGSRRSLAVQFEFQGERVFIINNHLCSKSGDTALFGEYQPPVLSSETERLVQAAAVRDMVEDILTVDPDANVIVLGDLNDFQFSAVADVLKESSILSLTEELLPENEQYSYLYNGNSQQLDHIYATPGMLSGAQVDIVHRYAEFDDDSRSTDHDPVVAAFSLDSGSSTEATLFFSEYAEGSSYNKYLEIYNSGDSAVSLDGYLIENYYNGSTDSPNALELSGTIAAGDVIVVMNDQASGGIASSADVLTGSWALNFNGDDCMRLVDPAGAVLDQIGVFGEDPGSGWDVGSTSAATANHTLVRKPSVTAGNDGDWPASAGTGDADSEWIVYAQDYWTDLGIHTID